MIIILANKMFRKKENWIFLFLIFLIIGLPIYMLGCSKLIGGGCSTTYNTVKAKVIKSCNIYKKYEDNDDHTINSQSLDYNNSKVQQFTKIEPIVYTYGDCRIKMSYGNNYECYL